MSICQYKNFYCHYLPLDEKKDNLNIPFQYFLLLM
jgi:hypothetical protein